MEGIEALLFDVFGTVVDCHGSVTRQLKRLDDELGLPEPTDWDMFAKEWNRTHGTTVGDSGSLNVDILHRETLDKMLKSSHWSQLGALWDQEQRDRLNLVWHKLDGWPDTTEGLSALKKRFIIAPLSNGNVRLLVDMAKYSNLPWDVVFSTELFGGYKQDPRVYLGAAHHLSIPPTKCAMVAAHLCDLRGAASHGMKTIYVRRPTEDAEFRDQVKSKADGGEVDIVVDSLIELAAFLRVSE